MITIAMRRALAVMAILIGLAALPACNTANAKVAPVPDPAVDDSVAAQSGQEAAVVAGGCFWGMQLVFEHVKGVVKVTAGYAGGLAKTAEYETVSTGKTGHAESVKIVYDPSQITYGRLLKVFFSVAHNPTELNYQGPDEGTQYRSVIFYTNEDQQRIAEAYIHQLTEARSFSHKIVTQVVPLEGFYPAEAYHQDYAVHNPQNMYIMVNDLPKLGQLRKRLPDLYVGKQ
jgi:peptide-methionine (S)-S-oxide reductase